MPGPLSDTESSIPRAVCREVVTVRRPRALDGALGGLRSLVSDTAMNLAKYRWPVFSRSLWQTVSGFFPDVVVAHNFHMAAYLLELAGPARLLREQNVDSDLMERYAATCGNPALALFARLQARRLRAEKARPAPRADFDDYLTRLGIHDITNFIDNSAGCQKILSQPFFGAVTAHDYSPSVSTSENNFWQVRSTVFSTSLTLRFFNSAIFS